MKNNNRFFKNFKQWGLKVSVSSVIFVSVVILGGAIITLASPSSLNDVKSNRANYQLTAENWDYVVDQMNGAVSNLIHLSGKVSTTITNIINLNGKFDELSGNIANTTGIVGVDEAYVTNEINTLDTSLKQWASNTFLTEVFVPKVTYYRGVYDDLPGPDNKCSSNSTLTLRQLSTSASSDIQVTYCGTPSSNGYYSYFKDITYWRAKGAGQENTYKPNIFSGTMLSNHDMCSLAGIGGAFDGRGEYISFIKRSNKIDLYIRHATDNALDFIATCVDFSDKSASQTFSVTTSVSGYLRGNCGGTPACAAGYYSVIGGETGDGCGFLKNERAVVCVKETKSTKKVGDICIASVISRGSLSTGMVGFTVKKGKVDAYGRCISDNSILYSPNALNASAHEYWTTNRDLGTVSV